MPFTNDATSARLIHTVHVTNLPSIVIDECVCCPDDRRPSFAEIFSLDIVARRSQRVLSYNGQTLGRYVSCLLTPRSSAHLVVATGYGIPRVKNTDIVHIETSLRRLDQYAVDIATSDRNALARDARVTPGAHLETLDWDVITSGQLTRDPADPTRAARAAAEVLVRGRIPLKAIERIVCWDSATARSVADLVRSAGVPVSIDRDYFFDAGK